MSENTSAAPSYSVILNLPGLTAEKQQRSDLSISVSAPGKVILHGEHSVVYGKLAVAASLGLRTKLTFVELGSNHDQSSGIRIELPALNLIHTYNFNDIQLLLNKQIPLQIPSSYYSWKKPDLIDHEELLLLVKAFVCKNSGTFPLSSQQRLSLCSLFYLFIAIIGPVDIPIKPFSLKIETDLAVSSGSGSSASFSVAVAAAFIQYIRVRATELQLNNVSRNGFKPSHLLNTDLDKFNDRELELISKWAYLVEKIIHGTPSGIDNTVCTYGSVVEFRKSTGPKVIQLDEIKLLLVNTKVKRDTKRLVNNVAALRDRHPQVVELILNGMDEISQSAIDHLKQLNDLNSTDVEKDLKQCYDKLGELTDMNHHLLQALGVSHPMLDKICGIFRHAGLCGKLTGAGGGGYAMGLIPSYFSNEEVQKLIKELTFQGFEATLTNLGGPGVTID